MPTSSPFVVKQFHPMCVLPFGGATKANARDAAAESDWNTTTSSPYLWVEAIPNEISSYCAKHATARSVIQWHLRNFPPGWPVGVCARADSVFRPSLGAAGFDCALRPLLVGPAGSLS